MVKGRVQGGAGKVENQEVRTQAKQEVKTKDKDDSSGINPDSKGKLTKDNIKTTGA